MQDGYARTIEYLRLSLTDRCNLRCRYCMPKDGIVKMSHEKILRLEEIVRAVKLLSSLGIKKVRLTGGEPLVRLGVVDLVHRVNEIKGIENISLTTNGILLGDFAEELYQAGLRGLNISLDTLSEDTFEKIADANKIGDVLRGIEAAKNAGFRDIKFNCVPIKNVNEADIIELVKLTAGLGYKLRFIELMPIGQAKIAGLVGLPLEEVRQRIENEFGKMQPVTEKIKLAGPAVYYKLPNLAGEIGFISALSHKFCAGCNRVRLTADGFLKLCLHSPEGLDLRSQLRADLPDEEIIENMRCAIYQKPAEHYFTHDDHAQDARAMYQIGG